MRTEIEQRLAALTAEFDAGKRIEADLQVRLDETRRALLRISGARQVLEELLAAAAEPVLEAPRRVAVG